MRAVVLTALGGPEGLESVRIPRPDPQAGEVLIAVRTVAANRQDLYTMRGWANRRAPLQLPHVMGIDPAGIVAAVGGSVTGITVGDRVVVKPSISCGRCQACVLGEDDACESLENVGVHRPGGMAEYVAIPQRNVFMIPAGLSFAAATAISHSFPVALTMLRQRARLTADDTVLVTSASGAVGSAAVQLARIMGARVIAAAGGPTRTEHVRRMRPDATIDYRAEPSFADAVRVVAPEGVSLYVETAGDPDVWREALRTVRRRGRIVVCGSHGGPIVELDLNWLFRNRVTVLGSSGSSLAIYRDVLELAGAGRIAPNIHGVFPLERVRDAFAVLLARENTGKVILAVTPADANVADASHPASDPEADEPA